MSLDLNLSEPLPPAANGLIRFLFAISLNVTNTLRNLEAEGIDAQFNSTTIQAHTIVNKDLQAIKS